MLAEQGPIGTDEFTHGSILWKDGAFYMQIDAGPKRRWKLMLTPPLRDKDWQVQILGRNGARGHVPPTLSNPKDPRVIWSRSFASAFIHLPPRFADATMFQVRAIPEPTRVVFFLEMGSLPAWITFAAKPSGEILILDRGF